MPTATTLGLCLRRRDVGEHDAVVTFFTREAGKRAVMAKGVKRLRSRNAPACQSFVLSRLQIATGQHLPVLAQAEVQDSFYGLRGDVWRSAYAAYVCELTDRALPDDEPQADLFDQLHATLVSLMLADDAQALVHGFELGLLQTLGYDPVLDGCARCGQPLRGDSAPFVPSAGGLLHPEERRSGETWVEVDSRTVRALRRLANPDAYGVDLISLRLAEPLASQLRAVIGAHLRYHLDTDIKSARVLDQLRAHEPPPT